MFACFLVVDRSRKNRRDRNRRLPGFRNLTTARWCVSGASKFSLSLRPLGPTSTSSTPRRRKSSRALAATSPSASNATWMITSTRPTESPRRCSRTQFRKATRTVSRNLANRRNFWDPIRPVTRFLCFCVLCLWPFCPFFNVPTLHPMFEMLQILTTSIRTNQWLSIFSVHPTFLMVVLRNFVLTR